jgi:hypothetical protein
MADSQLDLTIPFDTWIAQTIGDGTWADVIVRTKIDKPGNLVDATEIKDFGGQLVANVWDDMFVQSYRIHQGNQLITHDSASDDKDDIATLDTLTADGDAVYIRATVTARDITNPAFLLEAHLGATFYRSGGSLSELSPISTITRVGLTTATTSIFATGDTIIARVQGENATDIAWDFTVDELRRLR